MSVAAGIALYEAVRQRRAVPSLVRPIPSRPSAHNHIVGPAADDDEADPGARPYHPNDGDGDGAEDDGDEATPSVRHVDLHDDVAWGQGPIVLKPVGFDRARRSDGRRRQGRRHGPHGQRRGPHTHGQERPTPGAARGHRWRRALRAGDAPHRKGRRRRRGRRRGGAPGGGGPPQARRSASPRTGLPARVRAIPGPRAEPPEASGGGVPRGGDAAGAVSAREPASGLHGMGPFARVTVCRWRSSAVERLICNQRVGGSIPSASSNRCRSAREAVTGGSRGQRVRRQPAGR